MKRFIFFFLLSVFSLSLQAQEEYIKSFHSDLKIEKSGLLTVTEIIEVYAAGNQIQRGIVRSLPLSGNDYRNKTVKTEYVVISVERDGSPSNFSTEKKSGNLFVYIGDKDILLQPGLYSYQITYVAKGQLGHFDDYDEIYWNVNGFEWNFPIEKISAEITIPKEAEFDEYRCYTGFQGSTESNCKSTSVAANILQFEALNLSAGQNLTISAGFTKGVVSMPPPPTFWEKFGLSIIAGIAILVLMVYYITTWIKYGIDPPSPTVIPEFDVPDDLSPASIGIIHKGYFWNELISASIVNLAVKGYLQINEKKKSYIFGLFNSTSFHIEKLKEADETLSKEETILMQKLFSNNNVAIIDGKYSSQMKALFDSYMKSLMNEHKPMLTQGQNWKFLPVPIIIFVAFGLIAKNFDYNNYESSSLSFNFEEIPLLPLAIFLTVFIGIMTYNKGKNWGGWIIYSLFGMLVLSGAFYLYSNSSLSLNSFVLVLFIAFALISFFTYAYLIRKPSVEKLELRAKIDGFKRYLSAAEERQLQMFNPPQLTPQVFEQLLPYAMVFKVDKIWGKKFQNLVERGVIRQQQRSSWYTGSRAYSYHTLGNHFSRSLTNSISSSSGKNSGGSGSRGGGSSGGGRGGGGGGGW